MYRNPQQIVGWKKSVDCDELLQHASDIGRLGLQTATNCLGGNYATHYYSNVMA